MVTISSSSGARITTRRRWQDRAHRSCRDYLAPDRAQQLHDGTASRLETPTPRRVKGILGIRADLALESADLLGRALTVLIGQWGLDAVEVRIAEDEPEAVGLTGGNSPHVLTVAGHDFPLILESR